MEVIPYLCHVVIVANAAPSLSVFYFLFDRKYLTFSESNSPDFILLSINFYACVTKTKDSMQLRVGENSVSVDLLAHTFSSRD